MAYAASELMAVGNKLFSDKETLNTLWQELAENFYVERATFTVSRSPGDSFADNLTSSYPIMARRDLGNMFGAMLRPRDKTWFRMTVDGLPSDDVEAHQWLEWATALQRNAMYDRASGFVRATKEGDHDYATFGQCVISTQMNLRDNALLYRCHHLRDVAWREDITGDVDYIDNKLNKVTVRQLIDRHGEDALHPKMVADSKKEGGMEREVQCRHIVLPSEEYKSNHKDSRTGKFKRYPQPWVSIYLDVENEHAIEESGSWTRIYTIPRWQTVSDSQYSYSPATVAAIPDARLFQSMALTLLEAGQKYTNPPMVAVAEAIRGDVNMFAGGMTWVDSEYDERLGDVLRPISQDKGSMGIGFEMQEQIRNAIHDAFFLNRINLPQRGSAEMTAYETAQHVQEYIRDALPIFEPMEHDYNGSLCEDGFETLMRAGAYGDPRAMPPQLQDRDVKFTFESPLHSAEERMKGQQFMGALGLIGQAMGIDPSTVNVMNIKDSLRDAIMGSGTPADWMYSAEESAELDQQAAEQQQTAQLMDQLGQGAEIAKTAGEAGQALGVLGDLTGE